MMVGPGRDEFARIGSAPNNYEKTRLQNPVTVVIIAEDMSYSPVAFCASLCDQTMI